MRIGHLKQLLRIGQATPGASGLAAALQPFLLGEGPGSPQPPLQGPRTHFFSRTLLGPWPPSPRAGLASPLLLAPLTPTTTRYLSCFNARRPRPLSPRWRGAWERQGEGEGKRVCRRGRGGSAFKEEPGRTPGRAPGPQGAVARGGLKGGPQARRGQNGNREAGQALVDSLEFGRGRACRQEERNRVGKESIKLAPKPAAGLQASSRRGL